MLNLLLYVFNDYFVFLNSYYNNDL